jgi:microcystin-dependent protein
MSEPFIGEIRIFGFNFAPKGWATCQGQLLAIAQNTALFSILGTSYGGDGKTTFALPNFQGIAPMHQGSGPGLTPRVIGESSGAETITLNVSQMASHNHAINCNNGNPNKQTPAGNFLSKSLPSNDYAASGPQQMSASATSVVGGGQPHNNMQPYLTLNFSIALVGIFPPRN